MEITISNPKKDRKFGYGISTTPTGNGTDIARPSVPDYKGTFAMIERQIQGDRAYLSSIQSAYKNSKFFYNGKIITAIRAYGAWYEPDWTTIEDLLSDGKPLSIRTE
jgi:hypothetical protein